MQICHYSCTRQKFSKIIIIKPPVERVENEILFFSPSNLKVIQTFEIAIIVMADLLLWNFYEDTMLRRRLSNVSISNIATISRKNLLII